MTSTPTYRVSTVLSPPYVMNKTGGSGYEGFIVDLLDAVAAKAGFKYHLQLSSDGQYGSRDSSGRWNGMVGDLMRRDAEIAAGALSITTERERVIDFTKPFMSETLRMLIKKPSRVEPGVGHLLQPFSDNLWVCIFFALVLVAILFMLIGRFNPYEWRQVPTDKDPRGARHSFGLRNSFMFVFSSLTLQGYRETPRSLAGRVLAVSWFIFVFFIIIAFIGNSVALSFSSEQMETVPFENIEDLADQNDVKVGMIKGSNFQKLDNSNVEVYKRLAAKIKSDPESLVKTTAEGVKKVQRSKGKFVMLMESSAAEYYSNLKPCNVMLHGQGIFTSGYGLATRTGMSLRSKLTLAILELRENGTLQKLWMKWWQERSQCMPKQDATKSGHKLTATKMTLSQAAAPFIILLVGIILAVVTLAGEVLFKKLRK